MLVPDNSRMKDVLIKYILRIGLEPEVIDDALYFYIMEIQLKK